MSMTRWEPLAEMDAMRHAMDRMFSQMLPAFGRLPSLDLRAFSPNVEVYQTDKEVVIQAELPGIDPKHVTVEATEDSVHLSGELRKESEVKEDNYYRTERQFGQFDRIVPLPNRIRDQEVKATFKHGLLTIRAPLAEEVKRPQARKIRIEGT